MDSTTLSHSVNNNTCSLAAVAISPKNAQKRRRKQMRFWKQFYTIWDISQCLKDTMSPKNDLMICFQENPVMNFSHPWETHYQVLPIATCTEIWTFGRITFVCASWNIGVDTFDSLKKQKTVLFNTSLTFRAEGADPPSPLVSMTVEKSHSEAAPIAYFVHVHSHLIYYMYSIQLKLKVCAKQVLSVREWLLMI